METGWRSSTIAIESDPGRGAKGGGHRGGRHSGGRWARPRSARAFGDISAVPTLFMFDGQGRTAAAFYGATPSLHAEAEAKLSALLGR